MIPNRRLAWCILVVAALGMLGCKNDLSTPKAAARTFARALNDGDAAEAKRASTGGDPQVIDSLARFSGNMTKLHDVSVAKFGDQGKSLTGAGGGGPDFADWPRKIDDATLKQEGDTATLTFKDGGEPLKLKKIEGDWKVDAGPITAPLASMGTGMVDSMAKAAAETADEIKAGKYKNVQEAQDALGNKMVSGSVGRLNAPGQAK